MSYLILCDGPDLETSECTAVPAEGFIVVTDSWSEGSYEALALAIIGVFVIAITIRLILRIMGFR